jgi:hypothetical protein
VEPNNRQTWCAPKELPNPVTAGDKVQTTEQQLDRLEKTVRFILDRGFKLVLVHPIPEPGGNAQEIMHKRTVQGLGKTKYAHVGGPKWKGEQTGNILYTIRLALICSQICATGLLSTNINKRWP